MTQEEYKQARQRYFELSLTEKFGSTPATTKELDRLESLLRDHVDSQHVSVARCIFPAPAYDVKKALNEAIRNQDKTNAGTLD